MIVTRNIEVRRKKAKDVPDAQPPPIRLRCSTDYLKFRKHNRLVIKGGIAIPVTQKISLILIGSTVKVRTTFPQTNRSIGTTASPKASSFAAVKYFGTAVTMLPRSAAPTQPKEETSEENILQDTIEQDGVAAIAFECRKLLKCPNPDPTPEWGCWTANLTALDDLRPAGCQANSRKGILRCIRQVTTYCIA